MKSGYTSLDFDEDYKSFCSELRRQKNARFCCFFLPLLVTSVLIFVFMCTIFKPYIEPIHIKSIRIENWEDFKKIYPKNFSDFATEILHKTQFLNSKEYVEKHNKKYESGKLSFKVGLNKFADMPKSENMSLSGPLSGQTDATIEFAAPINVTVPDLVDWREHGYVTEVKEQGLAVGVLEGQQRRKTGVLATLSAQNIVDCSVGYGLNSGCLGGSVMDAYNYISKNQGVDTDSAYPYTAHCASCKFNSSAVGSVIEGVVKLPSGDEEMLKIAVATQGPISVDIDAGWPSRDSFLLYQCGVYFDPEVNVSPPGSMTHAALIVGYGVDKEHGDYWIVKNSWGADWGEGGYIRMARNKNNYCGIASQATYPLV